MNLITHTKRQKSRGGGTAIFSSTTANCKELNELKYISEKQLELCGALLTRPKQKSILLINIYFGFTNREEMLKIVLEKVRWAKQNHKHAEIVLGGDFNMNFFNVDGIPHLENLITDLQTLLLIPTIQVPTRVENSGINTSATCIDNFFITNKMQVTMKVLVEKISDHYPILLDYEGKIKPQKIKIKYRERKADNIDMVEKLALQSNFSVPKNYRDVNELTSDLQSKLNSIIEIACPEKELTIRSDRIKPDWLTKDFEQSI